ncbi:hypothetical protein [Piscirickettsia salmonis]|uniref:hypothetical protein n=1 Tax=Piscirickettsia salmonis TaxID=1238 RepID=UPI003A810F29
MSENQLSVDEQLTLALKLIEAVQLYHHKTGKAHLDLKPDNICIDSANTLYLIDYANSADLAGVTTAGPITSGYVPNKEAGHPNESADLIALKRCLHYPDKLCLSAGSLAGGGRLNSDAWIITDEVITQNLLLRWVVDTHYGELQTQGINAFKQMIAFIKENWGILESNIQLQKAIISLDNARVDFIASWERLKGDLELQKSIITLDKTATDLAASWTELKDSPHPSRYIAEKLNSNLDPAQGITSDLKKALIKDSAKPKRPAYDFNSIEHTITVLVHDIANNLKINQTEHSILDLEQYKFHVQFNQMLNNKIKDIPLSDLISLYYDIERDSFEKSHPLYWVRQKELVTNPLSLCFEKSETWMAAIELIKDKIAKEIKAIKQENSINSSSSIIETKAFNAAVDILDRHNINLDIEEFESFSRVNGSFFSEAKFERFDLKNRNHS